MAKEIANKQLSSKSIEHVVGYPIVKDVTDYALSYSLVSYVYQQAYLITGFLFANFVAPFPVVKNNLTWVDSQVDLVVLTRVDQVVDKANNFHPVSTVEKKYLAPVNSYLYSTVDKYLPGSVTENKAAFKLDELKESSEVSKFFKILNETYSRSKQLATAKSSEVTSTVADNYNKEVAALENVSGGLQKKAVASYNTLVKFVSDINNSFIRPLKDQTQDYVVDVATTTKNKADSFIAEAKNGIKPKVNEAAAKGQELLNGATDSSKSAPVVTASA
jgi:hypothetical protein